MPPGTHGIDDDIIRARCASAEAADYTLYVRRLVAAPDAPGGQAGILRVAASRDILPVGYTRQKLSEHLSGRYRHGPPWPTTEMIIRCLPDQVTRQRVRAEATRLYQAAAERQAELRRSPDKFSPDNIGSDNIGPDRIDPDNIGPDRIARDGALDRARRPETSVPTSVRRGRSPNSAAASRHDNPHRGRTPNTAAVVGARPDANQPSGPYRRGLGKGWPGSGDIAVDIADLRADCAKLTVLLLARGPGSHPAHFAELAAAFDRHQRSPLGQLSRHIDPAAPLPRRALAQYLCAYAELGRTTVTELAIRTGLAAPAVADILAARRTPSDGELSDLSAVLGVDAAMARQLAAHVHSLRPGR